MKILLNALKAIWQDFVKSLKVHKFKLLGIITMWVIPLVLLFHEGYIGKETKYSFRLWSIPVFVIMILIYWFKLRRAIKENLKMEKFASRLGRQASNALQLFFYSFLDMIMTTATIFIIYEVVLLIEQLTIKVSTFIAVVTLTTLIGKFFYLIDTIICIGRNYVPESVETVGDNYNEENN